MSRVMRWVSKEDIIENEKDDTLQYIILDLTGRALTD